MAFRKTVRSIYYPSISVHGFGEPKFSPSVVSRSGSSTFVSRSFDDCSVLSDSALPLTSLDVIVKNGVPISGSVSFRPSDPARVESSVRSAVSDYISSHPLTPSDNED